MVEERANCSTPPYRAALKRPRSSLQKSRPGAAVFASRSIF